MVEIAQLHAIYNAPHLSILLQYIQDKLTRNGFLILNQEIKHDIIYQRVNLPP
jgi:hypothetical protein